MRIEAAKSETKGDVVYLQGSSLDVKLSNHEQGSRLKYASSYILFFLMCTHGAVASGFFTGLLLWDNPIVHCEYVFFHCFNKGLNSQKLGR